MNRINRRQRVTPKVPKREPGQRAGFRPEARQQFIDDRRIYKADMQNNQIFDEMERRAKTRGQTLDGISDLEYGLLEGQVVGERALKRAAIPAALTGAAALGAGYAMNGGQQFAQVGTDPLAAARNSVAQANQLLGSERLLEAMTADQVESMVDMQSNQSQNFESYSPVIENLIDQKAQELMTYTVETAGGERGFSPELAYSNARDIVEKDLRAQGIL